jgi:hypothetical protein
MGFIRIGIRKCVKICPENYRQLGALCLKPASYDRGHSYQSLGDCQNFRHRCSFYGAAGYLKDCGKGFNLVGKGTCVSVCPQGWSDIGKGCVFENPLTTKLFVKRFTTMDRSFGVGGKKGRWVKGKAGN